MKIFRASTWRKRFYRFLHCFYNPKKRKAFGKSPKQLVLLCIFLLTFYLFVSGLFYAELKIVEIWNNNYRPNKNSPASTEILAKNLGLKLFMNILNEPPVDSTFEKYKQTYQDEFTTLKEKYKERALSLSATCASTLQNELPSCFIPIDDSKLNVCVEKSNALTSSAVVYWLTLSKVVGFVPAAQSSQSNFIGVECYATKKGNKLKLPVYPSDGINRNQLPYRNSNQFNNQYQPMPIMCTIVDVQNYDYLECQLKSSDIKVVSDGSSTTYRGYIRQKLPKFHLDNSQET